MDPSKHPHLSSEELKTAIAHESAELEKAYRWIEEHMPPKFLEEVDFKTRLLIARNLLSFNLQNRFSQIHLDHLAIVLCMDRPDADLQILKRFTERTIRYYRGFTSNAPLPGEKTGKLKITLVVFKEDVHEKLNAQQKLEIASMLKEVAPTISSKDLETLMPELTPRLLRSMTPERLKIGLEMLFKAKIEDLCQYEVRRIEDWQKKGSPSLQIIMAWRNVPKAGFLFRLARIVEAHGLTLQKLSAAYVDSYSVDNILILSLGLHGMKGQAAWEEANIDDFLQEICLLKYFEADDSVATTFVQSQLLTGNQGHLVRNFISFTHQVLVYADPNLYSFDNIVEGVCRHPELTIKLCEAFSTKFHPETRDVKRYEELRQDIVQLIERLDTGQAGNDARRKNILSQVLHFIDLTLKTNFYRDNKSAFSFRLDPAYLDLAPFDRREKFPELPFGVFFIRGMHFLGFNIRFKDLARGGVRTVIPERWEQYFHERNNIFAEAYNLALTQQKKNKDIPEGGAKTAILLKPLDVFAKESAIYRNELEEMGIDPQIIDEKIKLFQRDQRLAFIFASQRSFISSLMTLINCDEEGHLKADKIVDNYKKPEYIYLGPDENASNEMLTWTSNFSVESNYKSGRSFMSSQPLAGINHKEFGITSFGVNVYLHQTLLFLGIDPAKDPFTIKISGGPDGDVAGNEILNLYKFYPQTAKLLALTDVSGTIYDPQGLDLKEMADLFQQVLPIRNYPPAKLSEGGFLLDLRTKREDKPLSQQTLCWRKSHGKLVEEWLGGNEMNHLFRNNVHQVITDVFVPGGGRPRTLNEGNYQTFLDSMGKPTAKAIVEGANLYLTPGGRRALEKLGVLVLKDSSCNKGGVMASSFEVLAGLCMSKEAFLKEKTTYVNQVMTIIGKASLNEAKLLLETHQKTGRYLTDISEQISEKINLYKYQLLDHLIPLELSKNRKDPLIRALFLYCPPLLRERYVKEIFDMPDLHKKAIISCYLASHLVYHRGLEWSPNIADILPTLAEDPILREDSP